MSKTIPWPVIESTLITAGILVAAVVAAIGIKLFINKKIEKRLKNSNNKWHIVVIYSLKKTIIPISVAISLVISVQFWSVSEKVLDKISNVTFTIVVITIVYFLMIISGKSLIMMGSISRKSTPAATLTRNIINAVILIFGTLLILHRFGISITPLLTAVGVGGLAVALAMQETLSNFFAGIQVAMSGHLRSDDYIKLDSGEEGFITDMTWRETRLKTRENSLITIPNGKLAKANIINYNLPAQDLYMSIELGVDCSSDLERVERVTLEVAQDLQTSVPEAVSNFKPRLRFKEFGNWSIKFGVWIAADSYENHFLVRHEFIKRLKKRYEEEGIVMPFPVQALTWYKNDKEQ